MSASCASSWASSVGRVGLEAGALEVAAPAAALLEKRDEVLAGRVAAHDQPVGLVELGRVEELPETAIRAMQVAGEEDAQSRLHWGLTADGQRYTFNS